MTSFIHKNFLLTTPLAQKLYNEIAIHLPIIDYHNHLPPSEIASNKRFADLWEIWLAGDHYKWRAMRMNGANESLCTGSATPEEKFQAWATTVPHTLRNPLYHWTHLELQRHFGIEELLNPESANRIWKNTKEQLKELSVWDILKKFKVEVLCTTDDPAFPLTDHIRINQSECPTCVFPTFRPDSALKIDNPEEFNPWINKLSETAGNNVRCWNDFISTLLQRHDDFHEVGSRISDHGLNTPFCEDCDENEAKRIFEIGIQGKAVSQEEKSRYASFMLRLFAKWDAEKGWVKQFHIGALRDTNKRKIRELGRDTGFDSIGDWNHASALAQFLNQLEENHILPRTILYNLNPADNYVFGSMIGNFQGDQIPGKIQWGSGWWFLDQKEGMEWQINALSNLGLLSRFVGMLTDSRSFMSFPRHEYFRRILCNILGSDAQLGLIPNDFKMLSELVHNICYRNAVNYFRFPEK